MDYTIVTAFLTGLTTGGLSCLAVQGGLLTSSLANSVESDLRNTSKFKKKTGQKVTPRPRIAQPILFFLAAKLIAHTLLGFLLGMAGSVLSLSPVMRGILQLAIGIFMVGNAMRMFNVHPFFRVFSFEPPAFITRYIRRTSKNTETLATPALLGFLTIFIPCGITQSMLALVIGLGKPLLGAAIMFAFVLGTSPVFFILTYFATKLSSFFEKYFNRIAAVAILILGFITINAGLNLVGSPVTFKTVEQGVVGFFRPQNSAPQNNFSSLPGTDITLGTTTAPDGTQSENAELGVIDINVVNSGYIPEVITAPAGKPIKINLITEDVISCSRAFVIPQLNIEVLLPKTGIETIEIPAQEAGSTLRFACSMGMYTGKIIFQ